MKLGTLLLPLILTSFALAEPNQWEGKSVPVLRLQDGTAYTAVTFQKIEPASVTIKHDGGVAEIPAWHLSEASQEALGYDSERVLELRLANDAEIMRKGREAIEKEERVVKAIDGHFYVIALVEEGVLVSDYTPASVGGALAQDMAILSGRSSFKDASIGTRVYLLKRAPGTLVDGDTFRTRYAKTEETFQYTSVEGGAVTVRVLEDLGE
jgi:hypothetical protein